MPIDYFIHPKGIVESGAQIGKDTHIWAFTHILSGAVIGEDCNINDGVFIENDVVIGNRVTVKCGVQLWDGIRLEDDVFVGPNATFTNDPFPRSKSYPDEYARTIVRQGASVGANSTIMPGVSIGTSAMIGAGAVVTRDVPPNAIVVGNPARIHGYVSTHKHSDIDIKNHLEQPVSLSVTRARLIKMPRIIDLRGGLTYGEYDQHLPFIPRRYFVIFDVPTKEVRGEHAHQKLHQFLVCLRGSCKVVLDDGQNRDQIILNQPDIGLYIPPMVWATQYQYSIDTVLLVLASDIYDGEDYIRDYDDFLELVSKD